VLLTELARQYCVVQDRYKFFKFYADREYARMEKFNAEFRSDPRISIGIKNVISNTTYNEYRPKTLKEHVRDLAVAHGFDLPEVVDLEQPNS
jgi:hypothetical protein